MSTPTPTRRLRDGGRPQGAHAGDVGSGERSEAADLVLRLLLTAGLTFAAMIVAALIVAAPAILAAASGHPSPWDVVQPVVGTVLDNVPPIIVGILAGVGGAGGGLLTVLLVLRSEEREAAPPDHSEPDHRGGRP